MIDLAKNIRESIFGSVPTKELLNKAFEKKVNILATLLLTVQKYLSLLPLYVGTNVLIVHLSNPQKRGVHI